MRKSDIIFALLLVSLDWFLVTAAGFAAYFLRLSPTVREIRPVLFDIPPAAYFGLSGSIAALTVLFLAAVGLYRVTRKENPFATLLRIFIACSASLFTIVFFIFLRQEFFNSRFLILAGWGFTVLFLAMGRALAEIIRRWLARKFGLGAQRVLLIGQDATAERMERAINAVPGAGFRVVRRLADPNLKELAQAIGNPGVDEVVLTDPKYPRERVLDLVDFCNEKYIRFKFVPNLFQALTQNTGFEILGGVPLVEIKRTPLEGWGSVLKRAFDIAGASAALVLFAPLFLLIALAIKLDSPGPVFYRNRRVGAGREFFTLKLRSMYVEYCTGEGYPNAEAAEQIEEELIVKRNLRRGPVPKVLNDPRRTRVGRFLERTSLDELPQFFNVFFGHMSLVGPRPHVPKEVARYEKHHRKVLAIKPGITGPAQVSGRSDLDFEDEVRLDTYYIEHWSLWLDLTIMAKTPFVMLFGKHRS